MGNSVNKSGGHQLGVERSDEYPWGLKGINMPIPIDFARKLRNNVDNLQDDYRKFIVNRTYQIMPAFIDFHNKIVYNALHMEDYPTLELVKWNQNDSTKNLLGNGDINNLLEPIKGVGHLPSVHGFKNLFYYPRILSTLPDSTKLDIKQVIKANCWFTDIPEICAVMSWEYKSLGLEFNMYEANKAYFDGNLELYNEILSEQDNFSEFPYERSDDEVLNELYIKYSKAIDTRKNNHKILSNLSQGRNVINVGYLQYNPYNAGNHATSVIIDTIKKNVYILDSNGVGDCGLNMFHYFKDHFNWKDGEYSLIPVMHYKENETPRAFQAISRGGFCQTWNIFSQQLVLLNDVGIDINKIINVC
jgi:hypothetical protein